MDSIGEARRRGAQAWPGHHVGAKGASEGPPFHDRASNAGGRSPLFHDRTATMDQDRTPPALTAIYLIILAWAVLSWL